MWIARDQDGCLWIYENKPIEKNDIAWLTYDDSRIEQLTTEYDWFPEVKWEDEEPTELILKR